MTEPTVIAIIQARMSSSRLPGKVLRDLGGQPVLARVIARLRRSRCITDLIVATTSDPTDEPIAAFCVDHNLPVYRGSLYDVLDRYYQAAKQAQADVVVRITADCPMIDPAETDRVIAAFFEGDCDFASNRLPPPYTRTSPIGLDTEVCSFAALEDAWQQATEKFEREHVMPYLYAEPGRFRVKIVETEPSLGHLRFTIDTEADLQVARAVYASFDNRDDFTLAELVEQNSQHPQWQLSLADIHHKNFQEVDERAEGNTKLSPPVPAATAEIASQHVCPLCGTPKAELLTRLESFESSISYYHCGQCGFVFQDASESSASKPDFYVEEYRKRYQQTEAPTDKDLRQQRLRAADQIAFLKAQGVATLERALDVGASSGLMLEAYRDAYACEENGIEPGKAYRELAQSKGLSIFASIEELLASNPEPYSLISLIHVLEHLPDPVGMLTSLRQKLLSADGWLLVEVPNFYAHDSYELAHLSCFTKHSLAEMLRKAGFAVVSLRKHGYPRSELLPLYLGVLARPSSDPQEDYTVRAEKCVPIKRRLAMLWRKALSRLAPKRAWLPLDDES